MTDGTGKRLDGRPRSAAFGPRGFSGVNSQPGDATMLTTSGEAPTCDTQVTKPCHDCPWRRVALPGWLGGMSPEDWVELAHGEGGAGCHALGGPECAGLAIYRANVVKSLRDPKAFRLPVDRGAVFTSPSEFIDHHSGGLFGTPS